MAALGRGAAAAGKGGDRQVGRRVVFVAVSCFLFFLVCILSSRQDVTVVLDARKCRRRRVSSSLCQSHRRHESVKRERLA